MPFSSTSTSTPERASHHPALSPVTPPPMMTTAAPFRCSMGRGYRDVVEVCGPGPRRPHFDIFRARLAEQGYVEGKNLIFEQRFADCRYDRMPGLAAELVQVPVDVLFTMGTRAARIVAGP